MKTKILGAILLSCSLAFSSCNDFLDMTPKDKVSNKLLWSNPEYAKLAINDFYNYIHYYGNFSNHQCLAGLTEGLTETLKYGTSGTLNAEMWVPNAIAYGQMQTLSDIVVYLGDWSNLYEYIRRVNEAYANLNEYGTFDAVEKTKLEAEIRFFRGMLYFELMKRHKEVIIYDEDLSKIKRDTPLSTEEQGWDFVQNDLDFAGKNLPKDNAGRISKGAAYAFQSRAMLYAERWDVAKTAAEEVMKLDYALEQTSYADAFKSGNTESILEFDFSTEAQYHNFNSRFSPHGDAGIAVGGYGTPTQEMVESYELADGSGFPDWSTWHNTDGTMETPPYEKLEPRFKATILYNGAIWKERTLEPYVNGADGWAEWMVDATPSGKTTTGYYLRKLVDEKHDFSSQGDKSVQPWIAIRYAEVLLNYAEACYNLNKDLDKANQAIRDIRKRVGLTYKDKSGDALMAAIRQERKVELAYEGLWYWDMRRWKLAHIEYTGSRVHGLRVDKISEGKFKYTYVDCDKQDRYFPEKLYRIPMPSAELENNSAVKQYPEWR